MNYKQLTGVEKYQRHAFLLNPGYNQKKPKIDRRGFKSEHLNHQP